VNVIITRSGLCCYTSFRPGGGHSRTAGSVTTKGDLQYHSMIDNKLAAAFRYRMTDLHKRIIKMVPNVTTLS
jgi:hypothetical protein